MARLSLELHPENRQVVSNLRYRFRSMLTMDGATRIVLSDEHGNKTMLSSCTYDVSLTNAWEFVEILS